MSDETTPTKASKVVPVVDTSLEVTGFSLSLNEYCARLSGKGVGPEMIGGFHYSQTAVGNIKNSTECFDAAFDKFSHQPA